MTVTVAQLLLAAGVAGTWSAIVTTVALRVEVRWIKRALGNLEGRVKRLESEVFQAKRG